jgi:hypothetical protein
MSESPHAQTTAPLVSEAARVSAIRRWWKSLAPPLFFIALTVVMTWPLVLHMADSVVGQIGDNVYFVWMMAWFKRALFELHVSPINVPQLNYPEGWSLAYTEIAPSELALGFPASLIWGPVLGYNVALLLTFVLSGYFMYLWVRDLTGNIGAGLIGGTVFAFIPFRMAHFLSGHLNVAGTMWFPVFFMGLTDLLVGRRPRRAIILTGLGLGLIALTTMYYLYMTLLVSGIGIAVFLLLFDRRGILDIQRWKRLLLSGAISAPMVLAGAFPFIQLAGQGGLPSRSIESVVAGSASVSDFFLPSTDHFLWGGWIADHLPRDHWMEGTLYLGAISLPLAFMGFFGLKADKRYRNLILLLVFVAGVAFCLALGINLHWLEQTVRVPVPTSLQGLLHREDLSIRLPGYYMFLYFPLYSRMRTFKRFAIFVLMALGLMAGLGASWLTDRFRSGLRTPLTLGILALVFLDFYPGPYTSFAKVQARPVDAWLASQPGQGVVAQFPFYEEEDQDQVYNTLVHGKPFLGGFFNAFPPPQYRRIRPVMDGFPDQASVDLLRELNVEYVIVDSTAYDDFPSIMVAIDELGLKLTGTFGTDYVYGLPPA